MKSRSIGMAFAGLLVLALSCGGEERPEAEMTESPAMPDTTAASVWAHLQSANYQTWPLWPDKGSLYPGSQPHGMLLTTYVNDVAMKVLYVDLRVDLRRGVRGNQCLWFSIVAFTVEHGTGQI